MKLYTHLLFSTGLLTLLGTTLTHHFYASLLFSGVVASIGNTLIDRLGHETRYFSGREVIRRTPLTHTVPRSVMWGVIPAVIITGLYYLTFNQLTPRIIELTIISLLNGPSHMLLDAFTERGIYRKVNGKWRRVALAHFRYNDLAVNSLASLTGILMLFVAMQLTHPYYYSYYP
ncbi:DUF1286 domain-containing protein [Stygiolobus caldivivus]|uniref:DUF1286 domain-containing protein n=1 Tax=Stygiolobus caldivivus TaxID=2824673 RepID=A0A8D5ZJM0_9CREN|nr:DUF1286 domain-containing protein [Stygiolobus caldivivus]BCU70322.1 hypothetical protein KN1_16190 [Stygiolobus caldivivus]